MALTYYTKKEYNDMKSAYERKLKAADKKIAALEKKIVDLNDEKITLSDEIIELQGGYPTPTEEDHVTELFAFNKDLVLGVLISSKHN